MLLFESFNKYSVLKKRISNNEHYFIVVDTKENALKLIRFLENDLKFQCNELRIKEKIKQNDYSDIVPIGEKLVIEIKDNMFSFRIFDINLILDERYKEYFYFYPEDINIIRKVYNILPNYKPKKFIYEGKYENILDAIEKKESLFIKPSDISSALKLNHILRDIIGLKKMDDNRDENFLKSFNFNDDSVILFFVFYNLPEPEYSFISVSKQNFNESNIHNQLIYYPEEKNILSRIYKMIPDYKPKTFVYESDKSYIKYKEYPYRYFVVKVNNKEELREFEKKVLDLGIINQYYNPLNANNFPNYIFVEPDDINKNNRLMMMYLSSNPTEYLKKEHIYDNPYVDNNILEMSDWDKIKRNILYGSNQFPDYKPRKFVYENKKYFKKYYHIPIVMNDEEEINKVYDWINKDINNELSRPLDSDFRIWLKEYLTSDGTVTIIYYYDENTFKFGSKKYIEQNPISFNFLKYYTVDELREVERLIKNRNTDITDYKPRKFIYESKDKKVLNAFDMDDTLVYSIRFEEHVKPMLLREYLTPEIIMNNKLEDIGIGIDKLKYENGRIYFDDPHHEYEIPKGSSWVRKKDRIYITQPDAYFMTEESMPIGTYDDIVKLYNESEYRCIITARNERLRNQTETVLKKLGLKKPNIGLFMYPINSFSYTYEYKSNKLLELYKRYNFDEIHYYDDNIKLLKKIKKNLENKDINIKYYKVTKNRYRQI
jgi:hypothetical protein